MGTLILRSRAGSSYAATHYVTTFASVPGASNDWDDLGQASFDNAAVPGLGLSTTLGTAMAQATSSNGLLGLAAKVQCAPGTYTGEGWNLGAGASSHRFTGCFQPANSGTSGNPIVFFAQYPAATYYGSTSLYSELRRPNPPDGSTDTGSPLLLAQSGRSYVVFDGFYVDEVQVHTAAVSGLFSLHDCSNIEYRRMLMERDPTLGQSVYPSGGNFGMMYFQDTTDCRMVDCYIIGQPGTTTDNDANVEMYSCTGMVVEYCTFEDARWPLHPKGETTFRNNVTIRYNKFLNCVHGPETNTIENLYLHHNLLIVEIGGFVTENTNTVGQNYEITNNTIYLTGTMASSRYVGGISIGATPDFDGSTFKNNIIVVASGADVDLFFVEDNPNASISTCTLDYNVYYDPNDSGRWENESANYTSLSGWVAGVSKDANSIFDDPEFVNAAGGDFKLSVTSPARTAGEAGGVCGCYITGNEEIGVRANPTY